jgi:hypothetical protein
MVEKSETRVWRRKKAEESQVFACIKRQTAQQRSFDAAQLSTNLPILPLDSFALFSVDINEKYVVRVLLVQKWGVFSSAHRLFLSLFLVSSLLILLVSLPQPVVWEIKGKNNNGTLLNQRAVKHREQKCRKNDKHV